MRSGIPFRFKLFAIGALATLAAVAALGVSQWYLIEGTLGTQLRQRADDERPLLRAALASPLAERDYAAIDAILRESVTDRGLLYLVLVDRTGRVLAAAGDVAPGATPSAEPGYRSSPSGQRHLAFVDHIVVSDQFLARLHFGLSTRPIEEASSQLFTRAILIAAGSLLFSIVLMEILHSRVTRPLRRLGAVSREVRAGNYDVELARGADDEIGQLSEDFRHMIHQVRDRISALTTAESRLQGLLDEASVREKHLGDARLEAEAASSAKSHFLARMSHEIRTPLNGVLGMLELLLREPIDTRQRRFVELAQQSGRHLLEIVEDVLDYSRIEAGRVMVEAAPFDAHRFFRDLSELFAPSAQGKGLMLSVRYATLPQTLVGDAGRLRQIIGNLIANAIKFTAAGSIAVDACCTPRPGADATAATLHCRVTDTGIGIAAETLARLFAPFAQADESYTRRYEGLGLGLAISRGLAAAMGGHVHAESSAGQGSTFEVEVPVVVADGGPADSGDAAARPATSPLGARRVLLVEDNPVNSAIAATMLESLGCSVVAVATGQAALSAEPSDRFDAILLDLQLPDIDGVEVACRLAARWTGAAVTPTPIIALTANVLESDRRRCRDAGMQGFIGKPFTQADLAQALAALPPR